MGLHLKCTDKAAMAVTCHVFVDGNDVTNECCEFSSDGGWAILFKMQGRKIVQPASKFKVFGVISTDPPLDELKRLIEEARE